MAWVLPLTQNLGDTITVAIWNQNAVANPIALSLTGFNLVFDSGGIVIEIGQTRFAQVNPKATLTSWTIYAEPSNGTIQFSVAQATYAALPSFTNIHGTTKPNLSSQQKNSDAGLTGWTTGIAASNWVKATVDASPTPAVVTVAVLNLGLSYS